MTRQPSSVASSVFIGLWCFLKSEDCHVTVICTNHLEPKCLQRWTVVLQSNMDSQWHLVWSFFQCPINENVLATISIVFCVSRNAIGTCNMICNIVERQGILWMPAGGAEDLIDDSEEICADTTIWQPAYGHEYWNALVSYYRLWTPSIQFHGWTFRLDTVIFTVTPARFSSAPSAWWFVLHHDASGDNISVVVS